MTTMIIAALVECDRCHVRSIPAPGVAHTRANARRAGWDVSGGRLSDLCPECKVASK